MEREFTVIIKQDPESGWLVGEVTELPGCYTQARDMVELRPISARQSRHAWEMLSSVLAVRRTECYPQPTCVSPLLSSGVWCA